VIGCAVMPPMISRTLRVLRSPPRPGRWEWSSYKRIVVLRLLAKHVERKAP
jgi:hypothetical protein